MSAAILFVQQAAALIAAASLAANDIINIVNLMKSVIDRTSDPTDAEWAQLHAFEAGNTAIINAKMAGEE